MFFHSNLSLDAFMLEPELSVQISSWVFDSDIVTCTNYAGVFFFLPLVECTAFKRDTHGAVSYGT